MKFAYNIMRYLSIVLLTLVGATACDVHEFPEPVEPEPFTLHLNFDTELPFYKEVEYNTRSVNLYANSSTWMKDYDVRYIVEVYPANNTRRPNNNFSREADQRIVLTAASGGELNRDIQLMLLPGEYRFIVWTDYVEIGSQEDKFYDTSDFAEIKLKGDHCGSNDMRDAFRGKIEARTFETREAVVEMGRPLAKYTFVATDLEDFITRQYDYIVRKELERKKKAKQEGAASDDTRSETSTTGETNTTDVTDVTGTDRFDPTRLVNFEDFKVVFRYTGFMPCAYNLFLGRPADSSVGVFFESSLNRLSSEEAQLGFDYVFVNGTEGSVAVAVELYNTEGELLSRSSTIEVPLMRSKETVVRGKFLTHIAQGSVGISPGYDGEWNIEIP